jgi:hypothetical protein
MTQTAWLLEWPATDSNPTRYWNPKRGWMVDPQKACWFAREADADDFKVSSKIHGVVKSTETVLGLQRCPTDAEKVAQGKRCGCRGQDDFCPCQNVVQAGW